MNFRVFYGILPLVVNEEKRMFRTPVFGYTNTKRNEVLSDENIPSIIS